MLSMHNQEINQNIKLKDQLKQKNRIIKQLKSKKQTRSHSNLQPNKNNMQSYNLVKIKNDEMLEKNKRLTDLLKTQKQNYRLVLQQINEKEEKYTQLHNLLDKICKDLQLVDPQLLTFKIKNSVEKFKKIETEKLNLLKSNSNAFMRYSVSRQSASKQRPKRKGLKMQDLLNTSSKKSNSKEQAHSRSSNRSQFRSPQAFEQKRNRIRTTNDMNIKKDTPKSINQIQKLIKQIKQVNQQIKTIKNEHRNLTVILKKQQKSNNQSYMKAQQKFDKLTQTYIQHVNKLQNLKKEKEKLSNEMNEMIQK